MAHFLALLLFAGACAHRAVVATDPPGANMSVRGRVVGATPAEVRMLWWPWRRMAVRVQLAGYRPVDVRLTRDLGPLRLAGEVLTLRAGRLLGRAPRASHEILLTRVHGPAGTWDEGDIR